MELTERKLQILRAVIEEYIAGAQPVGSRALSKRSGLQLSAATLRNEMADLEEMGYLEKQHASAGRRPTHRAYRLYVGSLLDVRPLSEVEQSLLKDSFRGPIGEVRQVYGAAADAISRMTGCIAVVATPSLRGTELSSIKIVRLDRTRALALIVTRTGAVEQVYVTLGPGTSDAELRELSERATNAVAGVPLEKARARVEELLGPVGENGKRVMDDLFSAIYRNKDDMEMFLEGRQNIWLHPEYRDWQKARQFLMLLDSPEWLEAMLRRTVDMEFSIRMGPEVDKELHDLCVVTGVYDAGAGESASLGVIGPARMNYPRVLPVLRDVGRRITSALTCLREAGRTTKTEG